MDYSDVVTVWVLLPEAEEMLGLSDGLILHAIIKINSQIINLRLKCWTILPVTPAHSFAAIRGERRPTRNAIPA
jgi:hypothetical protein